MSCIAGDDMMVRIVLYVRTYLCRICGDNNSKKVAIYIQLIVIITK